ncbi:RICIN domain-containing protein [Actinoplanes sp. NPDC048796]|uniref:RICIN domain-containing protein n=1 Tax=Actinoplanes sp. NPDC048796 TaxID=3155640 RepID=UPI0033CE2A1F
MALRAVAVAVVATAATVGVVPQVAQAAVTPAVGTTIKAAHSNLCLNVLGGVTDNDAEIGQYSCSDAKSPMRVVPQSGGTFQIVVVYDNKCLNVYKGATDLNTPIHQYTCSATATNNLWRFEPVDGKTTYHIVSVQSGKCLNVKTGLTDPKTPVVLYNCQGPTALNDQFSFPPAVTASLAADLPVVQNTPVAVAQAGTANVVGALVYSYVNNRGLLVRGYQADPDNFNGLTWTTTSSLKLFTNHPTITQQPDGRVQVAARQASDGDLFISTQTAKDKDSFYDGQDVGGTAPSQPIAGRLADGRIVDFEIVNGQLWHLVQDGTHTPYGGWRYIGGTNLAGEPAVAVTQTGLRVFALNTSGALQTALYADGKLGDWTSLGGSGLTGTPAVLVLPGYRDRIVMRTADGTLVTKVQKADGTFEAEWNALPDVAAAGSPAIVLDPKSSRMVIVVRTTDGTVSALAETAVGSDTWGSWQLASSTPLAVDPTIVTFKNSAGTTWGYAARDANNQPYMVLADGISTGRVAARAASGAGPAFTEHRLPKAPVD